MENKRWLKGGNGLAEKGVRTKRVNGTRNRQQNHNKNKRGKTTKEIKISADVLAVIDMAVALFLFIAMAKSAGTTSDTQFVGLLGKAARDLLLAVFGGAGVFFPLFLLVWAYFVGIRREYWSGRMTGLTLIYTAVIMVYSLRYKPLGLTPWEAGKVEMGGGYLGGALTTAALNLVGRFGTDIIIAVLFIIGFFAFSTLKPGKAAKTLVSWRQEMDKKKKERQVTLKLEVPTEPVKQKPPLIVPEVNMPKEKNASEEVPAPNREVAAIVSPLPPEVKPSRGKRWGLDDDYIQPGLDLLEEAKEDKTYRRSNIKENIRILEETFASFGVVVKVNQVSCGPTVTRYELQPAPGVKVSKIVALTDDLQLSLAAKGIRIEAPIPGKSAVGIEVPNEKIAKVGLRELLSIPAFNDSHVKLPIALGLDVAGNPVIADLTDMPHLLIAGATGSGKSVCLNTIIISLLYRLGPQRLKLVMIDPKMVELTVYNGLPHLMTPVVTEARKAALVLRWMVSEMERRYKSFADAGVRDIYRYNETQKEQLPYIVVIIDELADLMMVSPVEVEDAICRLAQMARAAGIHLLVATQRPSVDVVTGIIKANMPSRIAFAVSSQADSRTILDMGGAEKLLGRGDMLFFPVGAAKPHRVQGAYVSDLEIERVVSFINENNGVGVEDKEDEIRIEEMESSFTDSDDELFWEAVKVFVDMDKASASLLQRKLRIGFTRAARLVDMMEERGIVSPPDTNKKREVLIDREQWERLAAGRGLGE